MRDGPRDVLPVSSEGAEPEAGGIGAPVERDVMDPRYGGAGIAYRPHDPSARADGDPHVQRTVAPIASRDAVRVPHPGVDVRGPVSSMSGNRRAEHNGPEDEQRPGDDASRGYRQDEPAAGSSYFLLAALRAAPRSAADRFARSLTLRCRSLELRTFFRSPRPMLRSRFQLSSSPPCASCSLRFLAASIAFRNAARTPASSRWRIASIVVPPGEVTISRSSTGCLPVSRSILAEPSIVWMISSVATSRDRRSRMHASIIAWTSRKKCAGPLPLVAVTASKCDSFKRSSLPT